MPSAIPLLGFLPCAMAITHRIAVVESYNTNTSLSSQFASSSFLIPSLSPSGTPAHLARAVPPLGCISPHGFFFIFIF